MSKIDQIISEMEEYIEGCSPFPLSSTKIVVVKEELEEMISELRLKTPDEIKKYQKLLAQKDQILNDANEQARSIIEAAQIHTNELVNESEIMQRAYEQGQMYVDQAKMEAENILNKAVEDANTIRFNAIKYTDDMLSKLQLIIDHSIQSNSSHYEALLKDLNKTLGVVVSNRESLRPQEPAPQEEDGYGENVPVN
ncbi:MAG: vacuolar family H+-ATPase subunit H [Lachnospiraceae bacterium]